MQSKQVSVIIPSYGENTNPCRAIDSVFSQDYENIQVIVVDDNGVGSAQQLKNAALFEKYSTEKRFQYIVHEINKGGSAARNTGAWASRGEYLCFLDDDDEFAFPSKISMQMKAAERIGEDWAGTYSSLRVFKDGKLLHETKAIPSGHILIEMLRDELSIGTAAPIITKKSFASIGGFDESFRRHQDWEFFARLLDRYKLLAVPDAIYNRYYKPNTVRKTARIRLEYMNHYAVHMRKELRSIDVKVLEKLLREKYVSVILSFIKENNIRMVVHICQEQNFQLSDYCYLIKNCCQIVRQKLLHI